MKIFICGIAALFLVAILLFWPTEVRTGDVWVETIGEDNPFRENEQLRYTNVVLHVKSGWVLYDQYTSWGNERRGCSMKILSFKCGSKLLKRK